jgi:hypothetical protein
MVSFGFLEEYQHVCGEPFEVHPTLTKKLIVDEKNNYFMGIAICL